MAHTTPHREGKLACWCGSESRGPSEAVATHPPLHPSKGGRHSLLPGACMTVVVSVVRPNVKCRPG